MYASFDRHSPCQLEADVLSVSWKGDARQGWLATGNSRKTVGVTYTETADEDDSASDLFGYDGPEFSLERQGMRRNFNFREHSSEVTIVRWNKHLDKIATCDSSGTVIVWRNHNGRSIMELVNNRGTAISDFQWSNDGNKVLIAYIDGYVLVGTAYGRRIWARQLNLGSFVTSPTNHSQQSRLLSSTWSPDDSRIVVGSSIGELIELDAVHGGTLVSTTEVLPGIGIIGLQWVLVPKCFPLESKTSGKASDSSSGDSSDAAPPLENPDGDLVQDSVAVANAGSSVRLSLYLRNGKVVLMNSCGDQQATIIRTGLVDGRMVWSGDGSILAVAGFRKSQSLSTVRFFQPTGQLLFTLPLGTKELVSAICWGHNDQKLFIATHNLLHTVSVHRGIPSLQMLAQTAIANALNTRDTSYELVLPTKLKVAVASAFNPIIQGHVPENGKLPDYVVKAPPPSHRTYCTVVPNSPPTPTTASSSSSSSQRSRHPSSYTLFVEHLGTLVPILEAHKRSSKIRQSFTIALPSGPASTSPAPQPQRQAMDATDGGESSLDLGDNGSGKTSQVRGGSQLYSHEAHNSLNTESGVQLACQDDDRESPRHSQASPGDAPSSAATATPLPQQLVPENSRQLVEVTSNVMASKFKIQGLSEKVPADMGSVAIKTSFLHIQPRKVIAYLPHPDQTDSGIDSDCSSDESSCVEDAFTPSSPAPLNVFGEPEQSIESLTSMEELQLPRSIELESQTLRPIETHSAKSHSHSRCQRMSVSESQIQIHSKTPTWNEQHMIYQLDFGGRVTTKSAKNFQLEVDGEQVLQFGRIDNGCFILDFQAPFSPIQAFATALANLV